MNTPHTQTRPDMSLVKPSIAAGLHRADRLAILRKAGYTPAQLVGLDVQDLQIGTEMPGVPEVDLNTHESTGEPRAQ